MMTTTIAEPATQNVFDTTDPEWASFLHDLKSSQDSGDECRSSTPLDLGSPRLSEEGGPGMAYGAFHSPNTEATKKAPHLPPTAQPIIFSSDSPSHTFDDEEDDEEEQEEHVMDDLFDDADSGKFGVPSAHSLRAGGNELASGSVGPDDRRISASSTMVTPDVSNKCIPVSWDTNGVPSAWMLPPLGRSSVMMPHSLAPPTAVNGVPLPPPLYYAAAAAGPQLSRDSPSSTDAASSSSWGHQGTSSGSAFASSLARTPSAYTPVNPACSAAAAAAFGVAAGSSSFPFFTMTSTTANTTTTTASNSGSATPPPPPPFALHHHQGMSFASVATPVPRPSPPAYSAVDAVNHPTAGTAAALPFPTPAAYVLPGNQPFPHARGNANSGGAAAPVLLFLVDGQVVGSTGGLQQNLPPHPSLMPFQNVPTPEQTWHALPGMNAWASAAAPLAYTGAALPSSMVLNESVFPPPPPPPPFPMPSLYGGGANPISPPHPSETAVVNHTVQQDRPPALERAAWIAKNQPGLPTAPWDEEGRQSLAEPQKCWMWENNRWVLLNTWDE